MKAIYTVLLLVLLPAAARSQNMSQIPPLEVQYKRLSITFGSVFIASAATTYFLNSYYMGIPEVASGQVPPQIRPSSFAVLSLLSGVGTVVFTLDYNRERKKNKRAQK
jgi:hypothetical protein